MFYSLWLATTVTIDLMDLLVGILIIIAILIGIYLIILLARLGGSAKKINQLVDKIDEPVEQTVQNLPVLIKKLDKISDDVSMLTESAKESVPEVLQDVSVMSGSVRDGVKALGGATQLIGTSIAGYFKPTKQRQTSRPANNLDLVRQLLSLLNLLGARKKKAAKTKAKR